MSAKVLGLGITTIDYLMVVSEFPQINQKIRCTEFDIQGGGNCGNTLVTLSRLGIDTEMISKVGNDSIGNQIKESLDREGVSTQFLIQEGETSPFSVVLVDQTTHARTIIHKPGLSYSERIEIDDAALKDTDFVYLDGRFLQSAETLAQKAKQKGIRIILEAERDGLGVEKLFKYAYAVVTSENYHTEVFGNHDFENNLTRLLEKGPSMAVTTMGEKGSILRTQNKTIRKEAYPTEAVDTTGAGDVFIGGFIFGLIQDWNIEDIIDFSSRVASIKCRQLGARRGIPYLKDVFRFFPNCHSIL